MDPPIACDEETRWEELVDRFAAYVASVADAHGLIGEDAEDLFGEVFVRIWVEVDRHAGDDAVRGAVISLTRRLAAGRPGAAATGAELDALDEQLAVQETLRRLPAIQREIARRRVVEGLDVAGVAAELGLAPSEVAEGMRRVRRRLHGVLEGERRRGGFRAPEH
jgi:DNA-directed RNA polymerase specialized sigma24 family protein